MRWLAYEINTGRVVSVGESPSDSSFAHFPLELDILVDIAAGVSPLTHYVEGGVPIPLPPKPSDCHEWDWTTKAWVPLLGEAKKQRLRDLLAEYRRRRDLPLLYDGKTLDTDAEARDQLTFHAFEFAERARLNQPAPAAARVWENADGTFHTFATDAGFRNWLGGFVIALSERTAQLRRDARQHAQAIRALQTVEEVLAYDITQGWPS